jgi:hypothetical protein
MPKTVQLNEDTKQQLATGVKETLTEETNRNNKRKFTAVDMWNRQRNGRSASDMMRRWNLN